MSSATLPRTALCPGTLSARSAEILMEAPAEKSETEEIMHKVTGILSSELLTCQKYKFTGSPLLFYVFLKQLEVLEQAVFILDTGISKSKSNTDNTPQLAFTMMLVY